MAGLKSLAKDTAIYGLSSIVGRFLNYMLVPLYTAVLPASSGGYGVVSNVYAFTALMLVLLTFGMETGFFRFANKGEDDPLRVYSTTLLSVCVGALTFLALGLLFLNPIDGWLEYIPGKTLNKGNTELVRVPLCDTAKEILARYSHVSPRLFPVICEAQYNMYIKFVLDFAGIHRMVTVLNPLTRQPEQKMLSDVATSHTARKTFIGDLYAKVKDQALDSSLTGHSPQSRAFQRYRTIDDTMKRELIGMLEE